MVNVRLAPPPASVVAPAPVVVCPAPVVVTPAPVVNPPPVALAPPPVAVAPALPVLSDVTPAVCPPAEACACAWLSALPSDGGMVLRIVNGAPRGCQPALWRGGTGTAVSQLPLDSEHARTSARQRRDHNKLENQHTRDTRTSGPQRACSNFCIASSWGFTDPKRISTPIGWPPKDTERRSCAPTCT